MSESEPDPAPEPTDAETEPLSLTAAQFEVIEIAHSHRIKTYEYDGEGTDDVLVLRRVMDRLDDAHPGVDHDEGVTVPVTPQERAAFERMVRSYVDSDAIEERDAETLRPLVD